MKIILCCLVSFIFVNAAFSQSTTDTFNKAKIYVIRSTGSTGSAVNFRIVADSITLCKVKNNSYAVIYVSPGMHKFFVTTWDATKINDKLALEMSVEAGHTYYLSMRIKPRFFETQFFVDEITTNSATPLLKKLKQDEKCD